MSDIISSIKKRDLTEGQQRTELWKSMRKNYVGGTGISSWLSKTISPARCIVQHLFGTPFSGNHSTRWGTIFEELASILLEKLLGTKQTHLGFIAHPKGGIGCSPDGIIPLKYKDKLKTFIIEYKCPITTIPSGKIPRQYVPQVQLGLMVLNECDSTIFVNNMFRRCSVEQFADNSLINGENENDENVKPLAFGIAEIYLSKNIEKEFLTSIEIDFLDELDEKYKKNEVYDFGEGGVELLFALIERKLITIKFNINNIITQRYRQSSSFIKEIVSPCPMFQENIDLLYKQSIDQIGDEKSENKLVGVMPWKLLKSDYLLINRDPRFEPKVLESLPNIFFMQKTSRDLEQEKTRIQALHKLKEILTEKYPKDMPCDELDKIIDLEELHNSILTPI